MKNFKATKLGEVLAFATLGNATIERSEVVFRKAIGNELTAHVIEMNNMHIKSIRHLAETEGITEIVENKFISTSKKLTQMRDLYLGDKYNDADELFAWFSFFEGASYGHWMVIKGIAEKENDGMLLELAEDGESFHFGLLAHIAEELEQVGGDK